MNEYVNRVINLAFCTKPLTKSEEDYIINGYSEENKLELVTIATRKKVLPVVGEMMVLLNIDLDFWRKKYDYFKTRNIEVTDLIANVFHSFAESGIKRICAFENYGAMLAAGTDIALYSSGDVDLYADVSQKKKIEEVMASYDYFPTEDVCHTRDINSEFTNNNGIIRINVAWKPLRRYLLPISIDASKYFRWNEMTFYKNTDIRLPSPETLLYLCFLRIAVHGYSRSPDIRLYIDTFNATRNNPNWEQVMQWAVDDGVKTKYLTVAAIANDLIRLDVPEEIIKESKTDKYTQRILKYTYDFEKHSLVYDPTGFKLLKVEAASDQRNVVTEILSMLFPPRNWLKEYYMDRDSAWYSKYVNYYRRLV